MGTEPLEPCRIVPFEVAWNGYLLCLRYLSEFAGIDGKGDKLENQKRASTVFNRRQPTMRISRESQNGYVSGGVLYSKLNSYFVLTFESLNPMPRILFNLVATHLVLRHSSVCK